MKSKLTRIIKIYPENNLCQECCKKLVDYKVFNTENNEYYYLCRHCLMEFDEPVETIIFMVKE